MVQRKTITLTSGVDGLALSVLISRPEEGQAVRGVLQLVHGMAEYKERYLPLMEYLSECGFACVIHDHRGHGGSMRSEEDKGYLYDAGAEGLVADTLQVKNYAAEQFPGLPLMLFGHSMGSLVARCCLQKHSAAFAGVILSGSPSENRAAKAGLQLAKLQKSLKGGKSKGKLLESMAFGGYYKKFPESRCAWVCADPVTVQAYEDDPMCGFTFTADGFVGLMELMCSTYGFGGWWDIKSDLPILFLGGEKDPCIDGWEKLREAMVHLHAVGFENTTAKIYPGLRHEICNERCKYDVFADIAAFLDGILSGGNGLADAVPYQMLSQHVKRPEGEEES